MAGMIQQPEDPTAGAPPDAAPAEPTGAPEGASEDTGAEPDENHPVFKQALAFAYEALYQKGAAKDVSQQLKAAPNLAGGMADIAYNITSVVDEKTDGQIPDELLVPMAMRVLEEVSEIAEASGLAPQPQDIAEAFKTMVLRFLGEHGVDTSQLQQAMDQVDPSVFQKAAQQKA